MYKMEILPKKNVESGNFALKIRKQIVDATFRKVEI